MDIIILGVFVVIIGVVLYFFFNQFSKRIGNIEKSVLTNIKDSFSSTSREALSENREDFLSQANERFLKERDLNTKELENKKELIDNTLGQLKGELDKVQKLMTGIEKDTEGKFTQITGSIKNQNLETSKLAEIINNLNKVLTPAQSRGQWGERMAEDILNLVGMKEDVNYIKQKALSTSRRRPDFTFILPQGKLVNMDVKFPFDNYRRYCEEIENEAVREDFKKEFLKNARTQIKDVTTRDYINTDANTLDYVIIFIPLEQAYSFIMEFDKSFIDDALKQKVIVCSPWTLYAYLSVIRQSIENFNIERSAGKIKELLNDFYKQWDNYKGSMSKLGDKIKSLQKEYDSLTTTRTNQLEKPLRQIEELSKQKELTANGSEQSKN
ncbi:MAG: DNA recombination protein RmuC [candidate division Zixibacteria bacterium]|nr:DNA recombination protein RmuC [candidate division Zixibacteria bacterium]